MERLLRAAAAKRGWTEEQINGAPAQANPSLAMSVPATRDGKQYVSDPNGNREPVCEACARQLVARFEREQLFIPAAVLEPDYFERAYHEGAEEQDV